MELTVLTVRPKLLLKSKSYSTLIILPLHRVIPSFIIISGDSISYLQIYISLDFLFGNLIYFLSSLFSLILPFGIQFYFILPFFSMGIHFLLFGNWPLILDMKSIPSEYHNFLLHFHGPSSSSQGIFTAATIVPPRVY